MQNLSFSFSTFLNMGTQIRYPKIDLPPSNQLRRIIESSPTGDVDTILGYKFQRTGTKYIKIQLSKWKLDFVYKINYKFRYTFNSAMVDKRL